jgi:hypothetical protein
MPRIEQPAEPWGSFFAEVDDRLSEDVQLHCCGGFVVTQLYGVARTTSDVDFLGRRAERRHASRGNRGQGFLALSKLERNLERDRDDVNSSLHEQRPPEPGF